jgi:hypothetical protein
LTFKDLKKRVSLEITQQQSKLADELHKKPFWIWNIEELEEKTSKQMETAALTTLLDSHKKMVLISLPMTMRG